MIENDFVCSLAIMFNAIKAICKLNMLIIDIFEQSDKNSEQLHNQANAADS